MVYFLNILPGKVPNIGAVHHQKNAFQGIQQLFVQVGLRLVAAGHVDDAAGNFHPVLRDTLK